MTTPTTQPDMVEVATIPCDEVPGIWRCGVGDAVAAIDCLTRELLGSKRKVERAVGKDLDRVLQAIVDARHDAAPTNYAEANDAGKLLALAALRTRTAEKE